MNITEYRVEVEDCPFKLAQAVANALKLGYKPFGSIATVKIHRGHRYIQPIIKEGDTT